MSEFTPKEDLRCLFDAVPVQHAKGNVLYHAAGARLAELAQASFSAECIAHEPDSTKSRFPEGSGE